MNRKVAVVFVSVGLILLILGSYAYRSTDGAISRALTGGSADAVLWFIISGTLAAITGVFGLDSGHTKQS